MYMSLNLCINQMLLKIETDLGNLRQSYKMRLVASQTTPTDCCYLTEQATHTSGDAGGSGDIVCDLAEYLQTQRTSALCYNIKTTSPLDPLLALLMSRTGIITECCFN